MSDHIYFGSLEQSERAKMDGNSPALSDAIQAGIRAGNINIASAGPQVRLALSSSSEASIAKTSDLQKQLEARRIARTIIVPTIDAEVRQMLRDRNEPITLFGERAPERRDRLQQLMAQLVVAGSVNDAASVLTHRDQKSHAALVAEEREKLKAMSDQTGESELPTVVYSSGSEELKNARVAIAQFSLPRAQARLEAEREPANAMKIQSKLSTLQSVQQMSAQLTEVGCVRPLSACAFNGSGTQLATASWAGMLKVWDIPSGRLTTTIKAHGDRISDVAFHPFSGVSQAPSAANIATAGTDGCVRLWSTASSNNSASNVISSTTAASNMHDESGENEESDMVVDTGLSAEASAALSMSTQTPIASLNGHFDRCTRLVWHKMGRYLASGSFDKTWRLWDIETQTCLCIQDGHQDPVYGLALHPDGSLLASGDLGGIVRMWDLRTGRNVFDMRQHIKQVNAIDFHPNGYYAATGSDDHTVLMWDLRKRASFYTIPAHTHLISNLRFQPSAGAFLMTSSYDKTCKVFSCQDWSLVRTFSGHDDKILRAEVSNDSKHIATMCWDRTWKLWSL